MNLNNGYTIGFTQKTSRQKFKAACQSRDLEVQGSIFSSD